MKRLHEINRDTETWRTAQFTETARPISLHFDRPLASSRLNAPGT